MKHAYILAAVLALPALALAADGGLYAPDPPPDSAFARFIVGGSGPAGVDVSVDGVSRVKALALGQPSNYLVVPAGSHAIKVSSAGKSDSLATFTLKAEAKNFYTLPVMAGKVSLLTDGTNKDKLKALLAVYNLVPGAAGLSINTADGATKVFSNVPSGQGKSLAVNAVSVDLKVTLGAAGVALKKATFASGGAYSIVVYGTAAQPQALLSQNRTEPVSTK